MAATLPDPERLSAAWRRRLARMPADRVVRAVVLLDTPAPAQARSGDRAAAVRAVRAAGLTTRQHLDEILAEHGGRWLTDAPDALGALGLEAPVRTILALAESEHVRAILEDQEITPLRGPRPRRGRTPAPRRPG